MTIRWVVFDIGGILEITPGGGDPTIRYPAMLARWEERLGMPAGELSRRLASVDERLAAAGKSEAIGTCTEEEWLDELGQALGWDASTFDAFMRDCWDIYCGEPNPELAAYLSSLRPRYHTALLSNSCVGARREEEARHHFSTIAEQIIYSHEVGVAKPDPRIYAITCERLGAQPEEIVFLDDVEDNAAAATAFGIHAIQYHDNAQAIAAITACLAAQP